MHEVTFEIGGHRYALSCPEGEEDGLSVLAQMVDTEVQQARSLLGGLSETRQLLLAALFLADKLRTAQAAGAETTSFETRSLSAIIGQLNALAERFEDQANGDMAHDALEHSAPTS